MNTWLYSVLMCFVACLAGCAEPEFSIPEGTHGERVKILRDLNVYQEPLFDTKGVYVLRSIEEYQQLCQVANVPGNNAIFQAVDFSSESVVIVARGMCDTSGYWTEIAGMALSGDTLQVFSRSGSPVSELVYMVISYPKHAVVVPKLPASVEPTQIADESDT